MSEKHPHCAEYDGQICTCSTIIWAMQHEICYYSEQSAKYGRCLYQRENERCDQLAVKAAKKETLHVDEGFEISQNNTAGKLDLKR